MKLRVLPLIGVLSISLMIVGCQNKPNTTEQQAAPAATQPESTPANAQSTPAQQATNSTAAPAKVPVTATNTTPAQVATAKPVQPAPPPPPPPPPPPVVIKAGTVLTIRLGQEITTKQTQTGAPFDGTMANPITVNGKTVVPGGSQVQGAVTHAKKAGKFKGAAELSLALTSITINGHVYNIRTELVSQQSTGKGKRSAVMIGGGAAGGAAIGGLAGGGKGAAIGALVGVGAGAIGAGASGNRDITLPVESVLSFKLDAPLTLKP